MRLEEVGKNELTIKNIKDKGSKVIVTFNNDDKIKLLHTTFLEFNLHEGDILDIELGKEIRNFEEKQEIIRYLKGLILKKPYNEKELFKKAYSKFKNFHSIKDAIKELKAYSLIDDKEYIDNYLDYFNKNNYGKYFIINFFRTSGLKEELTSNLVFDANTEKNKAKNYFDSIKNKFVSNNFAKQKKKIYDRMLQRGFDIDVIVDLINSLKVDETREKERLEKDFKKAKMKYFITNDNEVDANSKVINKLIDKGYTLEDINEVIDSDEDFNSAKEKLNE